MAEDTGARGKIQALLADRDETFQDVKNTLNGLLIIPTFPPFLPQNLPVLHAPYILSRANFTNSFPLFAEQLETINASTEDEDSDLQEMLATLLQHL